LLPDFTSNREAFDSPIFCQHDLRLRFVRVAT
jgi:hypothetical protein